MLSICLFGKWTDWIIVVICKHHILFVDTQILKLSQIWYSNRATVVVINIIASEILIRSVSPISLLKVDKLFLNYCILVFHQLYFNLEMFLKVYNLLIKHFNMLTFRVISIFHIMALYDLLIFRVEPAEVMFKQTIKIFFLLKLLL